MTYSFIASICHAQPCVMSNYGRSFIKLHCVVLCSMLYVTRGICLYNIESIKRMWNSWKTIRTSNLTIWHLTVRTDSQGCTKNRVFSVLFVFVFRNLKEQTETKTAHVFVVSSFHRTSRIHSKHILFKVLLLTVKMATSNLILSEDKVTIICRDIRIFRFHIILAGWKM